MGLALLQQSATCLSMAGAVTSPITLPAHAVSELYLAWRRHVAAEKPVVARFTQLMQAALA